MLRIPIKSDKSHAVVSVYKGLHVIYTNKTLIKAKIYSSYSINEVKAGQTYIKRKRKKRSVSAVKRKPLLLILLAPGIKSSSWILLHKYIHCYINSFNLNALNIYKKKVSPLISENKSLNYSFTIHSTLKERDNKNIK